MIKKPEFMKNDYFRAGFGLLGLIVTPIAVYLNPRPDVNIDKPQEKIERIEDTTNSRLCSLENHLYDTTNLKGLQKELNPIEYLFGNSRIYNHILLNPSLF